MALGYKNIIMRAIHITQYEGVNPKTNDGGLVAPISPLWITTVTEQRKKK